MLYQDIRDQIADGDVIAVRETHGFLTPFTRFFTHSPYTHAGVAVWFEGGLWMAELNGGKNHLIPLSQLAETNFDVFFCPVDDTIKVRLAIAESLRVKIPYSLSAVFVIGLLNLLHIHLFLHARKILVCSGYCVSILEAAGWPERSRLISPQELVKQLKLKLVVNPAGN
jgi:hypothetical protein